MTVQIYKISKVHWLLPQNYCNISKIQRHSLLDRLTTSLFDPSILKFRPKKPVAKSNSYNKYQIAGFLTFNLYKRPFLVLPFDPWTLNRIAFDSITVSFRSKKPAIKNNQIHKIAIRIDIQFKI
jgi:hypothetical protein